MKGNTNHNTLSTQGQRCSILPIGDSIADADELVELTAVHRRGTARSGTAALPALGRYGHFYERADHPDDNRD